MGGMSARLSLASGLDSRRTAAPDSVFPEVEQGKSRYERELSRSIVQAPGVGGDPMRPAIREQCWGVRREREWMKN
jgi:hypothetical protein